MPRLTQVAGIGKGPSVAAFVDPTMVVGGDTTTGPVNEGATIQIQILTTGIPDGATINYSAANTNSVSVADISLSSLSGTISPTDDKANLFITVNEDLTTEGSEELRLTFSYSYTHPDNGPQTLTVTPNGVIINDTSTTPSVPTYILNRSTQFANEGETFDITLVTANVATGTTVPYTITGVSSADIGGVSLTGSFVTGTTDTVTFNVTADATTENFETFNLALDNGEDSITVTINDTSLDPTYTVSASASSVNEGTSFTVNLTTTDVQDGVGVAYTITGVSSADIEGASLTGSFTVNNNAASLTVNTSEDVTLGEGDETFTLSLNNGADDVSVTIVDSSVDTTPTYTNLTLQTATSVNEGGTSTFRITGRNIAQNTTIDVNLVGVTGTVAANDFTPSGVTKTVTWTGASNPITQSQDFTITLSQDEITEGAESYKCVLAATDSNGTSTGDLESPTVTIGDTSLTPVTGQAEWTGLTTGNLSTTWTVPEGVTSVSMLCISGGGGGGGCAASFGPAGGGGGGGGLSYANNVSVTPGETLTIQAGGAGAAGTRGNDGGSGGDSHIRRGATYLCAVDGGGPGTASNTGGAGGGSEGVGTRYAGGAGGTGQNYSRGGGGGGAAGYSGNGGAGQNGSSFNAGGNGSGGGGGGGGSCSQSPGQVGGGGIQNKGQGTNGVGGNYNNDGGGGSGGEEGQNGIGGALGGGGGGTYYTGNPSQGNASRGAPGSVRIIYPGNSRQFPSTRTANENVVTGTYDTLVANKTSATEWPFTVSSEIITFTLTTSDVPAGTTVGYTFSNIQGTVTADDFINRDTLFTIQSDGTATVSMQPTGDWATEGTEIFRLQLAATDSVGFETDGLQSQNVSIVDNYPATVYNSISLDKTNYNEGETVTITVNYTNNTDKAVQVGYTATTSNGSGDLDNTYGMLYLLDGNTYEGPPYDGNKTVILEDLTTEGAETLTITLNDEDMNGNPTNNRSATATINDTSLTPRVPGSSLVGTIDEPTYGNTYFGVVAGQSGAWGYTLTGDNDIVVVCDPLHNSTATPAFSGVGAVYIYNRATQAMVNAIKSPYDDQAYRFGNDAVLLENDYGGKLLCVTAPRFKNTSGYFEPKMMVYYSTDNFASYTLTQTISLFSSNQTVTYGGNVMGFANDNWIDADRNWLIMAFDDYDNQNNYSQSNNHAKIYRVSQTAPYNTLTLSTTVNNESAGMYQASISQDAANAVIGNTTFDYTAGSTSYLDVGIQYQASKTTGATSNFKNGFIYASGQTSSFAFGSCAHAGSHFVVHSAGDDYSGNTNAGRLRFFNYSNGSLVTTRNNPSANSANTPAGNIGSLQATGRSATGKNWVAALWTNSFDSTLNKVAIYDAAGVLQYTLNSPGNQTVGLQTWNLRWGEKVHITENYAFIHADDGQGFGINRIYIY